MSFKQITLNVENNLLQPAWIAGQRNFRSATYATSKRLQGNKIEAVNIVATCEAIADMCSFSNKASKIVVPFKDLARLTFGVAYILREKVTILLEDTEHLLQQMNGISFDFDVPTAVQQPSITARKRKRVVTKQTTIQVSKRAKNNELLDETNVDYYRNLLKESEEWNQTSNSINFKESIQTECIFSESQPNIIIETITHELTLGNDIEMEQGFGVNGNNVEDILDFENLFSHSNSRKRKNSIDRSSSNILCSKIPRLNEFLATTSGINDRLGSTIVTPVSMELDESPLQIVPPMPSKNGARARLRQRKLIIDKYIKLSRKTLKNHRRSYKAILLRKQPKENAIDLKQSQSADILLNTFPKGKALPKHLNRKPERSLEEMTDTCENTLCAIFGEDYTEVLAKNILVKSQKRHRNLVQELPSQHQPEETNLAPPVAEINEQDLHNKNTTQFKPVDANLSIQFNNNDQERMIKNIKLEFEQCHNEGTDLYSVMCKLLNIWRNCPHKDSIDANKYLNSYPDTITAGLIFHRLLELKRDRFIFISPKLKSIEIDCITMGTASTKLISNFLQEQTEELQNNISHI